MLSVKIIKYQWRRQNATCFSHEDERFVYFQCQLYYLLERAINWEITQEWVRYMIFNQLTGFFLYL